MEAWSPHLIKVKIPQGPGLRPILLLAAYVQPLNKKELLQALDVAARQALESLRFSAVVIGGDLNASQEELREHLPVTEIMFVRTPQSGSRVDANGVWSQIDYICSTALTTTARRFEHLSQSDHAPIGCSIHAPHTRVVRNTTWRIKKSITPREVAEIIQQSAWPLKQMNRDPTLKRAMEKVAVKKQVSMTVKRILAAVNDPNIQGEQFSQLVLAGTRNDFRALLDEMRKAQFVNQGKFFQLAKIIARADRKSPLVQGVMNDEEVELNPQELLEQHLSKLYCEYNPIHRGIVSRELMHYEQDITRVSGVFQITPTEMKNALKRLAKNKALGVDGLPDNTIHAIGRLTHENDGMDGMSLLLERVNSIFSR